MEIRALIGAEDEMLSAVVELGDRHRKTLGHLAFEVFADYARRGLIVVAMSESGELLGYCLHSLPRDEVKVTHLCVAEGAQGRGVARALVEHLAEVHRERSRITLRCRRDYAVNAMWPKLGFEPGGELRGRGRRDSRLTQWVRYLSPPPTLFDVVARDDRVLVALDTNVFLDLTESRPATDVEGLRGRELSQLVSFVVTSALLAEIDRHPERDVRARATSAALQYGRAQTPPEIIEAAQLELEQSVTARQGTPVGDDLRHVAAAVAAGADIFVTRDHNLRKRLGSAAEASGMAILTPGQLVTRLDEERRYGHYRPAELSSTEVTGRQLSAKDRQHSPSVPRSWCGGEACALRTPSAQPHG